MRMIRYRAKVMLPEWPIVRKHEVPEGQWVYGEPHTIDCPTPHIHTANGDVGKQPIDKETLGQFTGLRDKNGTEIYEDDIVDCDYIVYDPWDDGKETLDPMRCVVEYDDFGFVFKKEEDLYYFLHDVKNIKVIGNLHDNPGLLEGGAQ